MTFAEIIDYEAIYPGTKFRRTDYPAKWTLKFDPEYAGMLVQHADDGSTGPLKIYHHDLKDGVWTIEQA